MTESIAAHHPPLLPAPLMAKPACGHTGYFHFATIKATHPGGEISGNTQAFQLRSLTGGSQELRFKRCPVCRRSATYEHRRAGQPAKIIGDDVQVIRAALHSLLAQPDVDIFTLVTTNGDGNESPASSYVMPRHHLPVFRVQAPEH